MRQGLTAGNSRAAAGLLCGVMTKGWVLVAALAAFPVAAAAAGDPHPVRARLVADVSQPSPGQSLHAGVLLSIEDGWHVYWKNPGDAGLATEVRITLPQGVEAGPVRWPAPHRFTQPGGLAGYGYEGSLLLASEVRMGGGPPAGGSRVTAEASWLACKDICLLGSARLDEPWPLPATGREFEVWRAALPAGDPPFEVSVTGGLAPGARRADIALWLSWPQPPGEVELFPETGGRLKVGSPRVQTRGSLTRVDLELTVVGAPDVPVERLAAVVAARAGGSPRQAWEIVIPLNGTS